jgi:hypothetical protein
MDLSLILAVSAATIGKWVLVIGQAAIASGFTQAVKKVLMKNHEDWVPFIAGGWALAVSIITTLIGVNPLGSGSEAVVFTGLASSGLAIGGFDFVHGRNKRLGRV